ncbi:hypothetical protein AHiyo1_30930 [Arthrobacter sp. Hiyo1]|nr:hypothetical protein AHiyo1_30930 [Arthrobacter sp. Hiyo1]
MIPNVSSMSASPGARLTKRSSRLAGLLYGAGNEQGFRGAGLVPRVSPALEPVKGFDSQDSAERASKCRH